MWFYCAQMSVQGPQTGTFGLCDCCNCRREARGVKGRSHAEICRGCVCCMGPFLGLFILLRCDQIWFVATRACCRSKGVWWCQALECLFDFVRLNTPNPDAGRRQKKFFFLLLFLGNNVHKVTPAGLDPASSRSLVGRSTTKPRGWISIIGFRPLLLFIKGQGLKHKYTRALWDSNPRPPICKSDVLPLN